MSKSGVFTLWDFGTAHFSFLCSKSRKCYSYAYRRLCVSVTRMIAKGQGQVQVTKGHYTKKSDFCRKTRALWTVFNVDHDSPGYFII